MGPTNPWNLQNLKPWNPYLNKPSFPSSATKIFTAAHCSPFVLDRQSILLQFCNGFLKMKKMMIFVVAPVLQASSLWDVWWCLTVHISDSLLHSFFFWPFSSRSTVSFAFDLLFRYLLGMQEKTWWCFIAIISVIKLPWWWFNEHALPSDFSSYYFYLNGILTMQLLPLTTDFSVINIFYNHHLSSDIV